MSALLTTQTTDATSSTISYSATTTITLTGVFASAKVALDITPDAGTTWVTIHTFHGPGPKSLDLYGTFSFRARLIGATALTSITATYDGSAA